MGETLFTLGLLLTKAYLIGAADPVKCYKNDAAGEIPINIYYCDDETKPECCEMDQSFTCCETQSSRAMNEQLMLWIPLAIIFLFVVTVCVFYRKDGNYCGGDETLKDKMDKCRCCSCCRKTEVFEADDIMMTQPGYENDDYGKAYGSDQQVVAAYGSDKRLSFASSGRRSSQQIGERRLSKAEEGNLMSLTRPSSGMLHPHQEEDHLRETCLSARSARSARSAHSAMSDRSVALPGCMDDGTDSSGPE